MAWISVHQEVDGPKLRKLAKALDTSKAEALGILNFLWFWGMNNADETGRVLEADRWDIENALVGVTKIPSERVVDALFDVGWLDDEGGCVFIHDWDVWQEQWYKLLRDRKSATERKRKERNAEKARRAAQDATSAASPAEPSNTAPPPSDASEAPQKQGEQEKKETKPKAPPKKKYAEFVSMTEAEYEKLIEKYGQIFTTACIEELDNYKGSKGKRYAVQFCHRRDISLVVPNIVRDLTGLINDTNYQFRAVIELTASFTMTAIGYTGSLAPSSVKHTGTKPDGEPYEYTGGDIQASDVTLEPVIVQSPSGGGNGEMAVQEGDYFTNVEINKELVKKEEST